jgi:DNA mismatch repair ATPase MutS
LTSKVFKDKTENTKKSSKKSTTSSTQTRYPFAGFPVSQREKFFQLLLGLGRSFVVVEEMDKAGSASKDRFVARRYTPGTLLSEGWQTSEETRYLLAVAIGDADNTTDPDHIPIGLAYIDVSTDRTVQTRTSTLGELEHELARISPVEVVLNRDLQAHVEGAENSEVPDPTPFQEALRKSMSLTIPLLQQSGATLAYVDLRSPVDSGLSQQLDDRAEALVRTHLQECLLNEMPKLLPASHRSAESFMQIDASTLLGLEIRQSLRQSVGATAKGLHSSPTSRAGTLLSVIKRTLTPSGTRLLVNSLCQPFTDLQAIARRHDLVESFLDRPRLREDLRDHLKAMSNSNNAEISRIIQRFSSNGNAAPGLAGALSGGRDLWDLKQSVDGIAQVQRQIREALYDDPAEKTAAGQPLRLLIDGMKDLRHWVDRIEAAVLPAALEKSTAASGALTDPETSPTESDADEDAKSQTAGEDSKANLWWINPS